jgi:hypothetical protein
MEELLVEGYDTLGTIEKINAIVDLVEKGKDFIEQYYFDNLEKIRHNHTLVNSSNVDEKIHKDIKSLF